MSDAPPTTAGAENRGGPQRIPRPEAVKPGAAPWWAAGPPSVVSVDAVRAAFTTTGLNGPAVAPTPPPGAGPATHTLPSRDPRPAAVLCVVWDEDGQATTLLTRRSRRLRSHTGEIAFPGGRLDRGEQPADAALREAHEEVGIEPATVELIGRLNPLATLRRAVGIEPYVGILAGRPDVRPNPAEVDRAFAVALADLMAPGVYHEELWDVGDGIDRPIHFFDLPGETVWGATGRMLRDLLDVVGPHLP